MHDSDKNTEITPSHTNNKSRERERAHANAANMNLDDDVPATYYCAHWTLALLLMIVSDSQS